MKTLLPLILLAACTSSVAPRGLVVHTEGIVCGASQALARTEEGARFLAVWSALDAIAPEPRH